ncbi:MAG TPA: SMP-30/gluconolactonase/LRE family protein, partial [Candidatus Limnocylindrales bacterium]
MLDAFTELAGGLDHPEGIAWAPDGALYAGGEAGQVYAIGLDGSVAQIASTDGFMYGLAVDGASTVYACDFGNAAVARIDGAGDVSWHSRGTDDRPMRVPNAAAFDEGGALFVTDSGEWAADDGTIFRVEPDGTTRVWSDAAPAFPNGCCLSLEGDALLVIESHARRVVRIPFADDGSAGTPEVVVELPGSQPDGLALASDGTMIVGCYRPDRLWIVRPGEEPEILAEDPDGVVLNQPANPCFVGPELDRLAVSSLGGWSIMWADIGLKG